MIRGELVMRKINLLRSHQFYISDINMNNIFFILEERLSNFFKVLQQKIKEIKENSGNIENGDEYLEDVDDIEKKMMVICNRIKETLKTKDINNVQYERLCKIIEHHILTSKNLFQSEKTQANYNILLNYLSEVPCYLEIDMDLYSIPGLKTRKVKINNNNKMVLVKKYNLHYYLHYRSA
ncbi:hypothetical protein SAMN02745885_00578 [Carboxydocella sporoproducens DSM 16521]|uniref:Uncharacterized protein n=2 Tax=Carboxydocella TaxID=178898 RepID=A0A1T4MHP9_9FIRM|nr:MULTISPECIES: hypothetical protein [Carboxydocella]AVX21333.1 hypothetical protein CFE_2170 [Carboxydocella thermautotrophica]SJZ66397.1 hypothetical protein SAMN02745885_00578 [Carboxydocella sporoproducens DSM 16521]